MRYDEWVACPCCYCTINPPSFLQIAAPDQLLASACTLALDIALGRRPRLQTLYRTDKLEPYAEATAIMDMARAQTCRRAPNLQHPLFTLNAIQVGIAQGGRAGLLAEAHAFASAAALDTHKALVHIFFAQRATKKITGVTDRGLTARPVKVIAVLGGGLMGSGIATACALAGMQVLLKEVNQKFLDAGLGRVRSNLASRVKKGRMTAQQAEAVGARVRGVLDYAEFGRVDMVIEAVIEDVKLKQQVWGCCGGVGVVGTHCAACGEHHTAPHDLLIFNTHIIFLSVVLPPHKTQPHICHTDFC